MDITNQQFKGLAERRFRQINPDVAELTIEWEFTSRGFVPDRSGSGSTRHGRFVATADGHRARPVIATMARGAKDVSLR